MVSRDGTVAHDLQRQRIGVDAMASASGARRAASPAACEAKRSSRRLRRLSQRRPSPRRLPHHRVEPRQRCIRASLTAVTDASWIKASACCVRVSQPTRQSAKRGAMCDDLVHAGSWRTRRCGRFAQARTWPRLRGNRVTTGPADGPSTTHLAGVGPLPDSTPAEPYGLLCGPLQGTPRIARSLAGRGLTLDEPADHLERAEL